MESDRTLIPAPLPFVYTQSIYKMAFYIKTYFIVLLQNAIDFASNVIINIVSLNLALKIKNNFSGKGKNRIKMILFHFFIGELTELSLRNYKTVVIMMLSLY